MLLSIVECADHLLPFESDRTPSVRNLGSRVEWIGPVRGPSAAWMRNRGAEFATGSWLLFKDPDCQIDLPRLVQWLSDRESRLSPETIIGGRYINKGAVGWQRAYHEIQRRWVHRGLQEQRSGGMRGASHLLGGAFLVHRERFRTLKGFSIEIGWGAEESELLLRHLELGGRALYSPLLSASHSNRLSLAGFVRRAWIQNYHRGCYRVDLPQGVTETSYFPREKALWIWVGLFFFIAALGVGWGRLQARKGFV